MESKRICQQETFDFYFSFSFVSKTQSLTDQCDNAFHVCSMFDHIRIIDLPHTTIHPHDNEIVRDTFSAHVHITLDGGRLDCCCIYILVIVSMPPRQSFNRQQRKKRKLDNHSNSNVEAMKGESEGKHIKQSNTFKTAKIGKWNGTTRSIISVRCVETDDIIGYEMNVMFCAGNRSNFITYASTCCWRSITHRYISDLAVSGQTPALSAALSLPISSTTCFLLLPAAQSVIFSPNSSNNLQCPLSLFVSFVAVNGHCENVQNHRSYVRRATKVLMLIDHRPRSQTTLSIFMLQMKNCENNLPFFFVQLLPRNFRTQHTHTVQSGKRRTSAKRMMKKRANT